MHNGIQEENELQHASGDGINKLNYGYAQTRCQGQAFTTEWKIKRILPATSEHFEHKTSAARSYLIFDCRRA